MYNATETPWLAFDRVRQFNMLKGSHISNRFMIIACINVFSYYSIYRHVSNNVLSKLKMYVFAYYISKIEILWRNLELDSYQITLFSWNYIEQESVIQLANRNMSQCAYNGFFLFFIIIVLSKLLLNGLGFLMWRFYNGFPDIPVFPKSKLLFIKEDSVFKYSKIFII